MITKNAKSTWNGTLKKGKGVMRFDNYEVPFTFASRFENDRATNPEELIGAAHSGCYSMFLSALITEEGLAPEQIETNATVTLESDDIGPKITAIKLECKVVCKGLSKEKFNELTAIAKQKCPVSRLYFGGTAKIDLSAELIA